MPPERAGQAVERALTELRQRPLTVVLGGAEPLLAGPTLQAALAAARPRDAETTLVVQTRGEHLDAARVEELQKAGARVLVCLHQVPGGTLQENLYRALEAGLPLVPAGIAGSAEQVLEFYERFLEMGFRTFRISPAPRLAGGPARMAAEEAEAFAQAYLEMADRAADYLRSSRGRLRISDLDVLVRRAIWPGLREEARGLSVDLGGDLYPFETWHLPDPAPARLGSLDDPRPLARMLEESDFLASLDRRSASSIGRCRTCPFRRLCEGGSALKALSAGDVMAPDPNCRFRQRVIEGLLWRLHQEPQVAAALAGLSAPPVPGPRG
jgi:radical SAM protein with 4Fe4S-binding SPASM domain